MGGFRTVIINSSTGSGGTTSPADSYQNNVRGGIGVFLAVGDNNVYFTSDLGTVDYVVQAECYNYDGDVKWDVIAKASDHFIINVPIDAHCDYIVMAVL